MQFPVVLRYMETLVVAEESYFSSFGSIDQGLNIVEANVNKSGVGGYYWIIDANGLFFRLSSMGFVRDRLKDKLLLRRRQERYGIETPAQITGHELRVLLEGLKEPGDDLHFVDELRQIAVKLGAAGILDRESMVCYMGE